MSEECIYIIPSSERIMGSDKHFNAAVFIVLYYTDKIDKYKEYIKNVPEDIDVYIISSQVTILERFDSRFKKVLKDNRGRDISGLLVAAKPYVFNYDYICFVHDKKEKNNIGHDFINEWEKLIWESLLSSKYYIKNLLYTMEKNNEEYMGVMLPFNAKLNRFPTGSYDDNKEGVRTLSKKIGIQYDENDLPKTYATCFWCMPIMLKKLLRVDWKYEDFSDPSVNVEGDLNHSVERIFKYLLKDRGKKEAVCISDKYMVRNFANIKTGISFMWERLDSIGIVNMDEMTRFSEIINKIRDFSERHSEIYIYGAGKKAERVYKLSMISGIRIDGFIVSTLSKNSSKYLDHPVVEYGEKISRESGIIIGVGIKLQEEVLKIIEDRGNQDYLLVD